MHENSSSAPQERKTEITMLGLDPGLSSTGYAIANVCLMKNEILRVIRVGIIETERQKLKQVRQSSDNLRRAQHHAESIRALISEHGVPLIALEMCSASQYIHPTFSFGVMVGVAASLRPPIIEVLPHEAKLAATGDPRATKAEVIAWALKASGKRDVGWPTSNRTNKLGLTWRGQFVTKAAEHPADALAVIQGALRTQQFKLGVGLFR